MAVPVIAATSTPKSHVSNSPSITFTFADDSVTGIVDGSLLVAHVMIRGSSSATINTPAGWTLQQTTNSSTGTRTYVFTRLVVDADTETSVTFTGTVSGTTPVTLARVFRVSGHYETNPINASSATAASTTEPYVISGVITTAPDCLVWYFAGLYDNSTVFASSWDGSVTASHDFGGGSTSPKAMATGAYKTQVVEGATGTATVTPGGDTDINLGVCIAIASGTSPPGSPSGLAATGVDRKVSLEWSAAFGADTYTVKRATSPGGPYSTVQSGITDTHFVDTGLENEITYYYVVSATNEFGEGINSAEASGTPGITPAIVASSVAKNHTSNSPSITFTFASDGPWGIVAGALLLAHVTVDASSAASINTPAGWTLLASMNSTTALLTYVFGKISDGTETSVTFTGGASGTTPVMLARVFRVEGNHLTNYLNTSATTAMSTAEPYVVNGVTTTVDDCLVLYFAAIADATVQYTATWTGATEFEDFGTSNGARGIDQTAAQKAQANAGATGTATATASGDADKTIGLSIAIAPIPPAGTLTSGSDTGVSTKQTASITPANDNLIIVDVWSRVASGTPNIPTAVGNGITYTVEDTVTYDGGLRRLTRFRGMADTPTAGVITLDWAGQSQTTIQWAVNQIPAVNTGGLNGSVACRNTVNNSGVGPSLTATLPPIQNARNLVFSVHAFADDGAVTPGTGFTELTDAAASDASGQMQTQYQQGKDRTADASQTAVACAVIATEIRSTGPIITIDTLDDGQAAGASNFDTDSVTPAADQLILMAVLNSRASGADTEPVITAFGLTWVKIFSVAFGASDTQRGSLYHAMGDDPTPGTADIDFGGQSQDACEWSLVEFGNVPLGVNGANAIEQAVQAGGGSTNRTTLSIVLAAFSEAVNNRAYGAFFVNADNDIVIGSGFTQLHEVRNATQTETLMTETKVGEDLSVDSSWSTSTPALGFALEIIHQDPAEDSAGERNRGMLLGVG